MQRPVDDRSLASSTTVIVAANTPPMTFQQCLRAWSVTPSMSRKGNPYDNARAESFVATLKTECFADSIAPTKAAAELMIFDYIETFYNPRRTQCPGLSLSRAV